MNGAKKVATLTIGDSGTTSVSCLGTLTTITEPAVSPAHSDRITPVCRFVLALQHICSLSSRRSGRFTVSAVGACARA